MTIKLAAKSRQVTGKKVNELRKKMIVPGVVYGHGTDNKNIEIEFPVLDKVFKQAGESTIIDLSIDGGTSVKTLISDVQYDAVKHIISHVDFHAIKMNEKITANVELSFVGESRLVKEENGTLTKNISEVEIHCLPNYLVHEIEVDISVLNNFDDVITIKDVKLPINVEITDHEADEVVALVSRPHIEEEPVVAEAEAAAETETTETEVAKEE